MEIGLFQLENLFLSRTQFQFIDIRTKVAPLPPVLTELLAKASAVVPATVATFLQEKRVAKSYPVVLLCENGKMAGKLARQLEAAGYQNIYTVTRGIEGLLSEL